jgi:hypothetical protein
MPSWFSKKRRDIKRDKPEHETVKREGSRFSTPSKITEFKEGRAMKRDAYERNVYDPGQQPEINKQIGDLNQSMVSLRTQLKTSSDNIKASIKDIKKDSKPIRNQAYEYEKTLVDQAKINADVQIDAIKEALKNAKQKAEDVAEDIIKKVDEHKIERVNALKKHANSLRAKQNQLSKLEARLKKCTKILTLEYKGSRKINEQEQCLEEIENIIADATGIQTDINDAIDEFNRHNPGVFPDSPTHELFGDTPPEMDEHKLKYPTAKLTTLEVKPKFSDGFDRPRRLDEVDEVDPDLEEELDALAKQEHGDAGEQGGGMHFRVAYHVNKNNYHDLVLKQIIAGL